MMTDATSEVSMIKATIEGLEKKFSEVNLGSSYLDDDDAGASPSLDDLEGTPVKHFQQEAYPGSSSYGAAILIGETNAQVAEPLQQCVVTDTERSIAEAAKNQVAVDTVFGDSFRFDFGKLTTNDSDYDSTDDETERVCRSPMLPHEEKQFLHRGKFVRTKNKHPKTTWLGNTFVPALPTKKILDMEVPYARRVRRARRREDMVPLMIQEPEAVVNVEPHTEELAASDDPDYIVEGQSSTKCRKKNERWTIAEVMLLIDGLTNCGVGKWKEIKQRNFSDNSSRTKVDLKDKWRNLLKTADSGGKTDLPAEILERVRQLRSE